MIFLLTLIFFSLSIISTATAEVVDDSWSECERILKKADIDPKMFPFDVAHGVHSLTVEELRHFEPNVTEQNNVPTINLDLLSKDLILPNAPHRPTANARTFITDALQTVDDVLTHMNEENWDVMTFSPLERIVHALHMQELWYVMRDAYAKINLSPLDEQTCKCVSDIKHNGVLTALLVKSKLIRLPLIVKYNGTSTNETTLHQSYSATGGRYREGWDYNINFDFARTSVDQVLTSLKGDGQLPLTDKASWKLWKDDITLSPDDKKLGPVKHPAVFLHCALKRKGAD